jgi:energy-coupling factor transporter ATP-binding protein EcfA2
MLGRRRASFSEILKELGFQRAIPSARHLQDAVRVYHSFRNYQSLAQRHGVVAFVLGNAPPLQRSSHSATDHGLPWSPEQRRVLDRIDTLLDLAHEAAYHPDDAASTAAADKLWRENRMINLCGPPGSGKTTLQKRLILRNHEKGGRGFFALFNNSLAARMREQCGSIIQVGTAHSLLGLDEPEMYWPSLAPYQIGLVDEISQFEGKHWHQLAKMWILADRRLVLFTAGDKWQMSGFGETRVWHTTLWRNASLSFNVELHSMFRCKCPVLAGILKELRYNKAGKDTMNLLRSKSRRAWTPVGPPTAAGMQRYLKQHKDTDILVVKRSGAEDVNHAAVSALYPRFPPRAILPGDVESCSKNYLPDNSLKSIADLVPSDFPVYMGLKGYLTKTLRKDLDFVNGMQFEVVGWSARSQSLRIRTKTNRTFDVFKWPDPDFNDLAYYPVRIGYASTILRMTGSELEHVTVYLDCPHVAAAGYTALSRVSTIDQVKIAGKVTAEHFVPAR